MYVSPGSYSIKSSVLNETNKCFKWTLFIDAHNHKVDRYFFILTAYNQSSINVDLEFNRTDFSPNASKVTSCTINSYSSESCTSSLQKKIIGSTTALVVVTSDLDKPLFEWQETICITTSYNFRADTWTSLWLPVFLFNIIVFTTFFLLFVLLVYKQAAAAKSKINSLTIAVNEENTDQEPSEETPLLQSNFLSQTRDDDSREYKDDNSPAVPANDQSLVVPVDIHPQSTSDTDDERNNDSESDDHSSTIPVEAPHSTAMDSEVNKYVDAEQRDANENVVLIVTVETDESQETIL